MKKILWLAALCWVVQVKAQLKPGFDRDEYIGLLGITAAQADSLSAKNSKLSVPVAYQRLYRSPEMGLKNRWELWSDSLKRRLVISIRGTVNNQVSWLENFYCAMVPAKGTLMLDDSTKFSYQVAEDSQAAVHVGWMLGLAYLGPDIMRELKDQISTSDSMPEITIIGHSQGGAIAYLLRSYLFYEAEKGNLPKTLSIKTYCSAAPKPGNLYYAYDFEFITRGGWALTVLNADDWVPETPFSLQTLEDFNELNPFSGVARALSSVKPFYVRWYLKHAYSKMDRSAKNTRKRFEKYLGSTLYKQVVKTLPEFKKPDYAATMNYMRTGTPVILMPDSAYREQFPEDKQHVFVHHGLEPYRSLAERQYE